jgi:hypothetical protein
MILAALFVAASVVAGPGDAEYRSALDELYDGYTDTALERLASLSEKRREDPVGPYLEALALCWKIEQRPASHDLDAALQARAGRAIAVADARLGADPTDARARFARGAAHGVRSRLALFRLDRHEAAREAVRMREDLLGARRLDPANKDALLGIGLYDYYADVLPRAAKILRFLLGIPGGDRRRGLDEIRSAREGSLFHEIEVRAQLYEILAFYEGDADAAEAEMEALHRRYPGSPLWALKLADHRRDRMGSYRGSAAAAREVIAAAESHHPNFAPVTEAMARVSLGESLLRDLRLAESESVLRGACAVPGAVGTRAQLFLGETLELLDRAAEAVVAYRAASEATDRDVRRSAEAALAHPRPPVQIEALRAVAEARRLYESHEDARGAERYREAAALWPAWRESAVGAADGALEAGRLDEARRALGDDDSLDEGEPPWVGAWARLVRARIRDAAGDREGALALYNEVFNHPFGRMDLRRGAEAGLREPWRPREGDADAPTRLLYSN